MSCRTFTHHVGTTRGDEAIRVECAAHPRWIFDARATDGQSARAVANGAAAAHEAGEDA